MGLAFKLRPRGSEETANKEECPLFPLWGNPDPSTQVNMAREMFVCHLKTLNCRGHEVVLL
jgi:hypothetical protein